MQRPLDVTVVAILIIVIAAFDVASLLFLSVHRTAIGPDTASVVTAGPAGAARGVEFLIGLVQFIAGILILSRSEMGRTIYLMIGVVGFVFAFVTSPPRESLVVDLIVFGIFLFVLYQPLSTQWFRRSGRLTSSGMASGF